MGIKNNFENALKKAISKDPVGYKAMLDEEHDCEKKKKITYSFYSFRC